ncbi:hypothetical protein PF005_g25201 [Phytophthora fragariae]|uniref:Uncharacterized protein n=1 Tax=Phytophthora fragariae TaxID=53985 RepID=A0A6A3YJZ8_9STRA|nr:hypothetical protein PF011_g12113 [Phytophthora fragariae]KAE9175897.1 hypothetical protein PF005_g25201 [Phytophthora fragariae]KAE9220400.1 hypothetical protein PF002_g15910 [Phytophthora fragariae]KAE9249916.1 hypothetical protein PF004_g3183 [Phytophthora fragariae]
MAGGIQRLLRDGGAVRGPAAERAGGKSLKLLSKLTFKRYEFKYDSVKGRTAQLPSGSPVEVHDLG